jgi:hypothetical protein
LNGSYFSKHTLGDWALDEIQEVLLWVSLFFELYVNLSKEGLKILMAYFLGLYYFSTFGLKLALDINCEKMGGVADSTIDFYGD